MLLHHIAANPVALSPFGLGQGSMVLCLTTPPPRTYSFHRWSDLGQLATSLKKAKSREFELRFELPRAGFGVGFLFFGTDKHGLHPGNRRRARLPLRWGDGDDALFEGRLHQQVLRRAQS